MFLAFRKVIKASYDKYKFHVMIFVIFSCHKKHVHGIYAVAMLYVWCSKQFFLNLVFKLAVLTMRLPMEGLPCQHSVWPMTFDPCLITFNWTEY